MLEISAVHLLTYALWGLLVGLIVGFTAIGKGLIGTPGLILLFKMEPVVAIGTMSVAGVAMMLSGSVQHFRNGNVVPRIALLFSVTAVPAAICSALFTRTINGIIPLKLIIGIIIIISVILLFYRYYINKAELRELEITAFNLAMAPVIGLFLGALMGMTSISGSIIIVLFMFVLKLPAPQAVGTTSLVALAALLVSSVIHVYHSHVDWNAVVGLVPGVLIGAALGAAFMHRVPRKGLRAGILVVLIFSGITVLFSV